MADGPLGKQTSSDYQNETSADRSMLLKIGIVTPYFYPVLGGVQEHVFNLYLKLLGHGHTVKILTSHFGRPAKIKSLEEKDVLRVGRAVPVYFNRSISRVTVPYRLDKRVKIMLKRERFDILHLHEPLAPTLPLLFLKHSGSFNIGTFHAYSSSSLGYPLLKPLLMKYFRRLHGRIAVSNAAKGFISRYFKGNYRIIPNGIDVDRFNPRVPPIDRYRDGNLNILFVGSLVPKKGLIFLLEAFKLIRPKFPRTRLIVVGSGPLEKSYKNWAGKHIGEGVFFEGAQHELLPSYYATCDIFCASSPAGAESFGIILLEAMASGRPVVASEILGYDEVITDGKEGLTFEPGNSRDLARALGVLVANAPLREKMGRAGRRTASEYSWDEVSRSVSDYYSEVIARQGGKIAPR